MSLIKHSLYILCTLTLITGCNHQPTLSTPIERHAYKLIFDNKIVGKFITEQYQVNDIIKNIETLEIKNQFKGMDATVTRIIETHEESQNGKVLRFSKLYDSPLAKKEFLAEAKDNLWSWQEKRGTTIRSGASDLSDDFLLHRGLRIKMKKLIKTQNSFVYSEWNTKNKAFDKVHLKIKGFDKNKNAWSIGQSYPDSSDKKSSIFWVDKDFNWVELHMNYLGKDLKLIRCDDECEKETLEALRPLDYQMLASPYRITEAALKGKIRYQIQMHSTQSPPTTEEQQVRKKENSWILDICADCETNKTVDHPENLADYLHETDWMETNDADLIESVTQSIKSSDTADEKMKALAKATRKRLEPKLQFSGYATALQAFNHRGGDCTEYAILLGAMGRIAKIPTRVVFGLSYSREYFHGKKHVFVPHAWVQAWVDGQWKSYDAGLENFDAGHIALIISDGDQQDFSKMFAHFSELKIISAQQVINKNRHQ